MKPNIRFLTPRCHHVTPRYHHRYTSVERAIVRSVRRRFLLLCFVFWLCWLPNVINAALLWMAWESLPYTTLTVLWYAMVSYIFNSIY